MKTFAQHMIDDHTKAGQQMMQVVQQANLPAPPQTLDARHQQMMQQLSTASDFDRAYLQLQLSAHQEAVQLFRGFAQGGGQPQLKQFASTTLPVLQRHLSEVQSLAK